MVTNLRILNLEPEGYSIKAKAILESIGQVFDGPMSREQLLELIKNYDILIVRLGHRIDAQVIDSAKRLKTIVTATTGLNHIDMNEAQRRGIKVLSLQGEQTFLDTIHATAEHTWTLLLALLRKLPQAHQHVLSGGWERDLFKGRELYGRTLGIIGVGRLGSKIAAYGAAFGMRVIGYDKNKPHARTANLELMDLNKVLPLSDVISLHVNYNIENHAMISRKELALMKPGTMLINTSRGELVDEEALLDALRSGNLGGAALDVLCGEYASRDTTEELLEYARQHDNLIVTPHIGGCTFDSMEKTEMFMAEKLFRYLKKEG